MEKQVLGKGLGAIFSTKPPVGETVISIPLSRIKPNKFQPRKKFDDEGLQDLANSINQHGLIQPITVVATVVPGEYELIAGERRFRASKLAGKTDIKAIVRQGTTDKQKMDLALIENIQRENFTPIEEAQAYNRLIEEFKHTHDEIAEVVGKNRSVITNTLRLLSLPEDIQNLIDDGKISSGHGRMLAGIEDEKQMRELVERILIEKLPVRAVEKIVSDIKKQKKPKTEKQLESEIINFKEEIQRKFGTKANVNGTNKKGKIEIFYYSLQDLERIAHELNIQM